MVECMARQQDSRTRTCSQRGCTKALRARGLCGTHYNQTLPSRHQKKTVACVTCGQIVERAGGGGRRFGFTCSDRCRALLTHGETCELPPDHWARMYGATCPWSPPKLPARFDCQWCGAEFRSRQPNARYCGPRCSKGAGRRLRRAREFNAPGVYTWTQVTRLWIAFDRCCAYCRDSVPLDFIQAEHVVPLSKGGRNDLRNLLPSCAACNRDKGAHSLKAWALRRAVRGLRPVVTTWRHDDRRYAHLASGLAE